MTISGVLYLRYVYTALGSFFGSLLSPTQINCPICVSRLPKRARVKVDKRVYNLVKLKIHHTLMLLQLPLPSLK